MNQENWVKKEYQAGLNFIIDHEEEAAALVRRETDQVPRLPVHRVAIREALVAEGDVHQLPVHAVGPRVIPRQESWIKEK